MRKSFLTTGISIFVVAAIAAYTAYLYIDSRAYWISTPVPSYWATYRNDSYGFEFRYPKEWQLHVTRGFGSPLTVELQRDPSKLGISIDLSSPRESVTQDVADFQTSDDFISAEVFETPHLRGARVLGWDGLHARANDTFVFNKPGTNLLFSAGVDSDDRTPELDTILRAILTSFRFRWTI